MDKIDFAPLLHGKDPGICTPAGGDITVAAVIEFQDLRIFEKQPGIFQKSCIGFGKKTAAVKGIVVPLLIGRYGGFSVIVPHKIDVDIVLCRTVQQTVQPPRVAQIVSAQPVISTPISTSAVNTVLNSVTCPTGEPMITKCTLMRSAKQV